MKLTDYILIAVIAAALILAVLSIKKHGGCSGCSGCCEGCAKHCGGCK